MHGNSVASADLRAGFFEPTRVDIDQQDICAALHQVARARAPDAAGAAGHDKLPVPQAAAGLFAQCQQALIVRLDVHVYLPGHLGAAVAIAGG